MALPSIKFNVKSNGVPIAAPKNGQIPLLFGMSSAGPAAGQIESLGSFQDVSDTYVTGPLAELAGALINAGVPEVLACRIFSGTMGSTTHVGSGSGTVTYSGNPVSPYGLPVSAGVTSGPIIKITTSGALGAALFSFSLDGGVSYTTPQTVPAGGTFVIPNTGITATFAGGGSAFTATDTYASAVTAAAGSIGSVTQKNVTQGAAQGAGNVTPSGSPVDTYEVIAQIATSGAIAGTAGVSQAVFSYSLDGGNTWSNRVGVPSSAFPIGESAELSLTFANTGGAGMTTYFVAGDQYLFNTTGPTYSTTDLTNQFTLALNGNPEFGFIIILGRTATASAAYTLATVVDTLMTTAASNYQFARALIETPADTTAASIDNALQAAFATPNLPSLRVAVGAGDLNFTTSDGLQLQRCVTWAAAIQLALTSPGTDIAAVKLGGLPGVADILRDESVQGGLDNLGFITARTWKRKQGYYLSSAQIMGAIGTNFQYLALGRVMDEALNAAYGYLVDLVNDDLTANADGTIDEVTARGIDSSETAVIFQALSCPAGDASGAQATLDRSNNIVSTGTLIDTIAILPKAYARQLIVNIGFAVQLSTTA